MVDWDCIVAGKSVEECTSFKKIYHFINKKYVDQSGNEDSNKKIVIKPRQFLFYIYYNCNMKKLLIILIIAFTSFNVNATHIMGGEITWECIKDPSDPNVGNYIFSMKLYRDCDGVTLSTFAQTLDVWDHPSVSQISLDFIANNDISPDCNVTNSGNVALDCASNPVGAVEEYIYTSQPVSLPGIPPVNGWHFTWGSCCRNGAITNLVILNPANPAEGFTLRASMFPYLDASGNPLPSDPCFDSSPRFNESPQTIICTGYPFSYTHNASDLELDSIVYNWDEPLEDMNFGAYNPPINPVPVPWLAPYTVNSPLPGGVTLDSQTGEISYNSNLFFNPFPKTKIAKVSILLIHWVGSNLCALVI